MFTTNPHAISTTNPPLTKTVSGALLWSSLRNAHTCTRIADESKLKLNRAY